MLQFDMLTTDFDYILPPERIAQSPAPERNASRLMVLDRTKQTISHGRFGDIVQWLKPGDVLVLNDTKVLPARLFARSGKMLSKQVEILLMEKIDARRWTCLAGPGRNAKPGDRVVFADKKYQAAVVATTDFGGRVLEFDPQTDVERLMQDHGEMPLPHYIQREEGNTPLDAERYQTVFAQKPGAIAAPTAALHFTEELLDQLSKQGVEIRKVTLHVGLGTFRPVKTAQVEDHVMHGEKFFVSADTAEALRRAKEEKRRIVAAGTTVVRTLESFFGSRKLSLDVWHETKLFILPGFQFRMTNAIITNFHLPRSTLLMLVSAFAGREFLLRAYEQAIAMDYRFYSYGDAMFIH